MRTIIQIGLLAGMLAFAGQNDKDKGHEIGCAAYGDCGWHGPHGDKGPSPTPEPGTLAMMGLAALGVGLVAWKRRRG